MPKIYKTTYRVTELDGMLAIYEVRLGQAVNPRLYSGWKRKILEFMIKRFFTRVHKELDSL